MVVGPEFGPVAGFCVAVVQRRGDLARRSATALAVDIAAAVAATVAWSLVFKWTGIDSDGPGEPSARTHVGAVWLRGELLALDRRRITAVTGPVIVGVEATDRSRDALALGLRMADGLDAELVAAYVHPYAELGGLLAGGPPSEALQLIEERGRRGTCLGARPG